MTKRVLMVLLAGAVVGCSTPPIDFGPEPGTDGDPFYWQYNPDLHGPNAPPRDKNAGNEEVKIEEGDAQSSTDAPPSGDPTTPVVMPGQSAPAAAGAVPVVAPPPPTPAPAPATTRAPAPESEALFNDAIRDAVASGDIDRALKLMEDAERLGSKTARQTFIDAVNRQGGQ